MRSIVYSTEIPYFAYLGAEGKPLSGLPAFAAETANMLPLYKAMVRTRLVDERAVALQRTGRLGTYASALGQEAIGVGVASAMTASDVLVPSFHEQAAQLWRGVSIAEHLSYWGGDERGSDYAETREDFPAGIPVATQFPHAVGVALAFQTRREHRAAVVFGGDGSTSKGDFYEALNFAGSWRLPVVFIVSNNQWAISVPRVEQTAAKTLAQKAVAAGLPGEQVDGNDVIAVRARAEAALAHARAGEGPTLIEALTYRLTDHTTADDASRYRDETEVRERWRLEPLARLRTYLGAQGIWTKEDEEALLASLRAEIDAAVESYLARPEEPLSGMFDHTYAALPADLAAQRATALGEG